MVAATEPTASRLALWIVEEDGIGAEVDVRASCPRRSNQVANWLRAHGVRRGDRLILMLGNQVELWETILAAMKLGAVLIPASTAARRRPTCATGWTAARAAHVVVRVGRRAEVRRRAGDYTRIAVGEPVDGWLDFADADGAPAAFTPGRRRRAADDTLLLYFTSGHHRAAEAGASTRTCRYPVGHLSTMYWIGLRAGRRAPEHLLAGLGEARVEQRVRAVERRGDACSSTTTRRFDAAALMAEMDRCGVTSFCAPPTVWRMLIQADLSQLATPPREGASAPASRSTPR